MNCTTALIIMLTPCIVTAANDRTFKYHSEEPPRNAVDWSEIQKSDNPSATLRSYFAITTDSSSVLTKSTHNQQKQNTSSEASSMSSISDCKNSDVPDDSHDSDTKRSNVDDHNSAQKTEYPPFNDILKHASSLTRGSKAQNIQDALDYLLPITKNFEYMNTLKQADRALLYTDIGCYYQLIKNQVDAAKYYLALGASLGNIRAEQRLKMLSNTHVTVSAVSW